jgi:hypothetical protein
MKSTLTILIFLIALISISAFTCDKKEVKYFEGKVVFKYEFTFLQNTERAKYMGKMSPNNSVFYFKEGNFVDKPDKGPSIEDIYLHAQNKMFTKKDHSDTLFWFDCGKPGRKVLDFKITPKKETILGIKCDELIVFFENLTISYYYNSDTLKVNPDWYKDFTYANKDFVTTKMGAIYLKCKIERPDYISIGTATAITYEKISTSLFEISPKTILVEDK